MSFNFQRGDFVPASFQSVAPGGTPTTNGPLVILNIKGHTLDLIAMLYDVTSSGSGGLKARLGGTLDAEGTINASLDLDLVPYGAPLIVAANSGIAVFGVSPTKGIQVPVIIERVPFKSGVDSEVQYSIQCKMNQLAGFLVYPPA